LAEADVSSAAALLRAGGLVAFPTETVYGLGGDATNDRAVAAIFAAKGRPRFNPLIIHVATSDAARGLVRFDDRADLLASRFWPGPLTLVLRRRADCPVSLLASAGLDSLAVRVPAHPLAHALLTETARPIAAPSANRSGRVSPTTADHVLAELDGAIAAMLDGGPCQVGIESTVIDLSSDRATLLRPGGVPLEALREVLGTVEDGGAISASAADAPRSPGMLSSHYAPSLPLRLEAHSVAPGEVFLGFGAPAPTSARDVRWLSRSGDPVEAAARLFATLHEVDRDTFTGIAVAPIPDSGLGRAINDRLRRAAAPRPVG
jgi:L-threonylcarbamoyladenylate synthase